MSSNRPTPNAAPIPGFQRQQVGGAVPSTGARVPTSGAQSEFGLGRELQNIGTGLTASTVSIANMMEQRVKVREQIEASRVSTEYQLGETMRATKFKGSYTGKPEDYFQSDSADQERFYNDFVEKQGGVFSRQDTQQSALNSMNKIRSGVQQASFQEQYARVQGATVAAFKEYGRTAAGTVFHHPTNDVYTNAVESIDELRAQMEKTGYSPISVQQVYEQEMRGLQTSYIQGVAVKGDIEKALELVDSGEFKYINNAAMYTSLTNDINAIAKKGVGNAFAKISSVVKDGSIATRFFATGDTAVLDQMQKSFEELRPQIGYLTAEQQISFNKMEEQVRQYRVVRDKIIGDGFQLGQNLTQQDYKLMEDKLDVYEAKIGLEEGDISAKQEAVSSFRSFLDKQQKASIEDMDELLRQSSDPAQNYAAAQQLGIAYSPIRSDRAEQLSKELETAVNNNDIETVSSLISVIMTQNRADLPDGSSNGHRALMQVVSKVSGLGASKAHVLSMFAGTSNFNKVAGAVLIGRDQFKDLVDKKDIENFLGKGQLSELARLAALTGSEGMKANSIEMVDALKTTFYSYKQANPEMKNDEVLRLLTSEMMQGKSVGTINGHTVLLREGDDEKTVRNAAKVHTQREAKKLANSLPTADIFETQLNHALMKTPEHLRKSSSRMSLLGNGQALPEATSPAQNYDLAGKHRGGRPHKGYDSPVPAGTQLYTPFNGKVTTSGYNKNGWGNYAIIEGEFNGKKTKMLFGHLSQKPKLNTSLKQGDKLALTGNSGRSTGAHLHTEMWVDGKRVDPKTYLYGGNAEKETQAFGLPLNDEATQATLQAYGLMGKPLKKSDARDVWDAVLTSQGFGDETAAEIRSLVMSAYSYGGSGAVKHIIQTLGPEMTNVATSSTLTKRQIKDYGNDIREALIEYGEKNNAKDVVTSLLSQHDKAMYKNEGFSVDKSTWTQMALKAVRENKVFYSYNPSIKMYVPMKLSVDNRIERVKGMGYLQPNEMEELSSQKKEISAIEQEQRVQKVLQNPAQFR